MSESKVTIPDEADCDGGYTCPSSGHIEECFRPHVESELLPSTHQVIPEAAVSHEYIHVGSGALYCKPCEVLATELDGAAAVRDMKEHEATK